MKKLFVFATMTLLLISLLASCGGEGNGQGDSNDTTPTHTHSFDQWEIVKAPTCKENGEKARYCDCGEKQTENVLALSHTIVVDEATLPTCTEPGKTEGEHCSVCGEVILAQQEIPMLQHTYSGDLDSTCEVCGFVRNVECNHTSVTILPAKNATCTESGATEGMVCDRCEKVLQQQVIIETLGHTEVIDAAISPTCTTAGKSEGKHCSTCGEVIIRQGYVAALGHRESDWIVEKEPTDSEAGYRYKKCSTCGEKTVEVTIPSLTDIGLSYTVNSDNKTCTVTGIGSFEGSELTVPEYINGYKVTAIGEEAFSECTQLTELVIPETTKTIGTRAFYGCTGLTEFTVPASVTSIGNQIFYKASNITTVYYNSSYGSSSNPVLRYNNITKVVFGGKYVTEYILYNCSWVQEVVILDGVTRIYSYAFSYCSSLTEIVIPDSVTSISYDAFRGCSSLTNIVIPDSVTSIGEYAFYDCSSLSAIVIPDSVTSIGEYAFYDCSSLTEILIPDSVTSIGSSAFSGCSSLTNIVIPDSVTSIGSSAFYDCSSLTNVYYTGNKEQWSAISFDSGNSYLRNANITYNYIPE